MKRISYLRVGRSVNGFTNGKEYALSNGNVVDDDGPKWHVQALAAGNFQRIERDEQETLEAHGFTWNKHVPGDPMPCDRDALVHCYVKENGGLEVSSPGTGKTWWWTDEGDETDIIGWRFAEEAKPEPVKIGIDWGAPPSQKDTYTEIQVMDVTDHRQMVAMDTAQPESAGEKAYRLKQQAKQEAEAQKEQAKAEQMAQAGEVFSREYDSKHDHKLGMVG